MQTAFWSVDPVSPDAGTMKTAGEIIRRGGLVAFPTETVYGLGADALSGDAAGKIYAAKGRPADNPLIVHIAEEAALEKIVKEIPQSAKRLMDVYWPGPLTMIFEKREIVPTATTGGLSTVAVRMPDHPVARALITEAGGYVAAPSANASGRPSPTSAAHVKEDLDGRIDLILDGGGSVIGLESTIVDFTEEVPTILRPGYVNEEMLKEVLGAVRTDPALLAGSESRTRPKAPGMRYRHYAPQAPLLIVRGAEARVCREIAERVASDRACGERVGVLSSLESAAAYEADLLIPLGSLVAEREIAGHLFSALRAMDAAGITKIYSEAFDTPRLGAAIMNRLLKAAGYQILEAGSEAK